MKILNKNKLLILFYFILISSSLSQEKRAIAEQDYQNQQIEMADIMRSEGKIYVVVLTVVLILVGFLIYLLFLDRKIARIERKIRSQK